MDRSKGDTTPPPQAIHLLFLTRLRIALDILTSQVIALGFLRLLVHMFKRT